MADTSNLSTFLTNVADAIRTKKETTDLIPAADFDTEILNLKGGANAQEVYKTTQYYPLKNLTYNGNAVSSAVRTACEYTIVQFANTTGYFLVQVGKEPKVLSEIDMSAGILGVYNNHIYLWTKATIYVYSLEDFTQVKTIAIPSTYQNSSYGFVIGDFYFSGNSTSSAKCVNRFNPETETFIVTNVPSYSQSVNQSGSNYTWSKYIASFRDYSSSSSNYAYLYDKSTNTGYFHKIAYLQGLTYDATKCIVKGSLYEFNTTSSGYAKGILLKENCITANVYVFPLTETIYLVNNTEIYEFDNETNTFTYIDTVAGRNLVIPYADGTDVAIGIDVNGTKHYYPYTDGRIHSDKIITNFGAYTNSHLPITGTMPDNGSLNYGASTSAQTIPAGYTSGGTITAVTASIDPDIKPTNIKRDVTILGVTGTLDYDSSEATATTADILYGKTAYIKGGKKTGTFTLDEGQLGYGSTDVKKTYIGVAGDVTPVQGTKNIDWFTGDYGADPYTSSDGRPDVPHLFFYKSSGGDKVNVYTKNYDFVQTIAVGQDAGMTSAAGYTEICISSTCYNDTYYMLFSYTDTAIKKALLYKFNPDTEEYEYVMTKSLGYTDYLKFHTYIPNLICGGRRAYILNDDDTISTWSTDSYGSFTKAASDARNAIMKFAPDAIAFVRPYHLNASLTGQIKYISNNTVSTYTSYGDLRDISHNHYGVSSSGTSSKNYNILKFNSNYSSSTTTQTITVPLASGYRDARFINDDLLAIYVFTQNGSAVGVSTGVGFGYATQMDVYIYKLDHVNNTNELKASYQYKFDQYVLGYSTMLDLEDRITFISKYKNSIELTFSDVANKLMYCEDKDSNRYFSYDNASTLTDLSNVLENTGTVIYRYGLGEGTMKNNGELNYTPSGEEQVIPAGYTSGGTIGPVTAESIGLTADMLAEGVILLGITGTYKGVISQEEYDTALDTANDILGKEVTE